MKKLYLALLGIVVIIGGGISLLRIINSPTFQFFGRLVPRVKTSQKIVALTFDDGPTPEGTDQILAVLDEQQVRATFFVTGSELEKNIDQGKRIVAANHELGNHSYSHQRMVFVSPSFVQQEVERTDELIREAGHQKEIYFRPPYGKKLVILPYYLSENGRTTISWDVAPESNPDIDGNADKIAEYVLSETRPGSIILLHVMYRSRTESLKAVKKIIEGLKAQGYKFFTVSELLAVEQ